MMETEDPLISPLHRRHLDSKAGRASVSMAEHEADFPEIVIRPQTGWIGIDWKELLAYRELLWFLVWRDVTVRYKQTILGSAWAILQPLMMMLIFTFVFGRIAQIPSQGLPYPVFLFAG